jgi:hypothetical protein
VNSLNRLVLATAATAALAAAATPTAYAGSAMNGPRLTGIALETLEAHRPDVAAVSLPSGEAVDLRQPATSASDTADPRRQAAD